MNSRRHDQGAAARSRAGREPFARPPAARLGAGGLGLEPFSPPSARAFSMRVSSEAERREWRNLSDLFARDPSRARAWILRHDGRAAGVVALHGILDGMAEIGFLVLEAERRQGLASRGTAAIAQHAFSALSLHRLAAATEDGNIAAIRVLEACGFRREGALRDGFFDGRGYRDCLLYGRLATDPP